MSSLIGTVISHKYELIELIGTGGMADVYKGKDIRLGRNVAVKILKPEFNKDQEFIQRFQTESKAIASLSHANIVNIYDVGFESDLNYIVMELVSGNTLKDYLDSIPGFMKEEAVINIGIQICSALAQAHSKQVVHRDVKAQNILIDVDGRIKVADFGIARAASSQTIVKTDEVFGSVHYASPEQARGKVVDRRSDLYSLGILLYELLTRELPFDSDSAVSVAMMQMKAKMPDPRDKNPSVTKGMAKIIAIATRKAPHERYQNAYEMISDLRKLKNDSEFIPLEKTIINNAEVMNDLLTEEDGAYDYEIEAPETTKSGYLISAILGAALAVVIGVVLLIGIVSDRNAASIVVMPDIRGMDVLTAKKELAKIGVKADDSETRFSEEVPKGYVISSSIEAGEQIKRGYTVKVVVSSGGELIRVPILLNLTKEKATEMIRREGFELGVIESRSSDKPAGYVIGQKPEGEQMSARGTQIDLIVSSGEKQELVYVPSLSGRTLKEAYEVLGRNKLEMGEIRPEHNAEIAKDVIISSDKVGEKVKEGTRINVVVSKGPRPEETTASSTPESETVSTSAAATSSAEETPDATSSATVTTSPVSSTSSSVSTSSSSAQKERTMTVTVELNTIYFAGDQAQIQIDFKYGDHLETVYEATHDVSEGERISVPVTVTGYGNAQLLIRYDSYIRDQKNITFE